MGQEPNGHLTSIYEHPEICRDFVFAQEIQQVIVYCPRALAHFQKNLPNFGMLVNVRQVMPV